MAYSGSAKGLKMATNFVNIDGHNFIIFIDGSEDRNEKYAQMPVLCKTIVIDLLQCRMWYVLHYPYTMNRHCADLWMCLLILIMDC
jgi:hypothetical protein